jgi:hypothetical protein
LGSSLFAWLRRRDSNSRPSGYEPDELPLLHAACSLIRGESVILSASHSLRQAGFPEGANRPVGRYLKRPPRLASMLRLMSSRRSSLVFKNFESFSSNTGSAPSGSSRFPRPPRR